MQGGYGGAGGVVGLGGSRSGGGSSGGSSLLDSPGAGPPVPLPPPGFGPIVASVVAILGSDGSVLRSPTPLPQTVLPVDVALSPDNDQLAIAGAGNGFGVSSGFWLVTGNGATSLPWTSLSPLVAVAFDGRGNVLAQTLEPEASLSFVPTTSLPEGRLPSAAATVERVSLSTVAKHNTGHDIFHTQAGAFIACASCHPEGGDDGHVWQLDGLPRRTPSLRGTIAGTAPYHWPGEERDMNMLIDDVYMQRMSGTELDSSQREALTKWVEAIPAPPAPSWLDSNAVHRGQALFATSAGCAACHSGPKFTNNATVDIGTGKDIRRNADGEVATTVFQVPTTFQVPPLVGVGWRTPLFHDGCASTIHDRFGRCATPQHGSTDQLSWQDIEDLTAYLESL
jgi:cytochrome c peroxidase